MNIVIFLTLSLMGLSLLWFPTFKVGKLIWQSYWSITLLGALFLWGLTGFSLSFLSDAFTGDGAINPLRILLLFFSFTVLAIFLDEVGLIRYLAYLAIHRAGMSQPRMFLIWFVVVSLATMLTANDIVILTLTPFIIYFSRHAKISPLPFLISQFVAANTWSMMLMIGNPTNIYLASMFALDFVAYFFIMVIPTIVTGLASYALLNLVFSKNLKTPIDKPDLVMNLPHPSYREGLIMLTIAILFMILSQWLGIGMDTLTVICALSLIVIVFVRYPKSMMIRQTLLRLPLTMVPFFLSMAMIVQGLNLSGLTQVVTEWLDLFPPIYGYGIASFLASNFMNNIPMTLWFTEMIQQQTNLSIASVYATIIGSNLGALLTPIGALAGLMWMNILKQKQVHFSFLQFLIYGVFFGVSLLLLALVSLDVIL